MRVLRSLADVRRACRSAAAAGTLGFVPTMGALHAGHLSLVERARADNDATAVSIFVNPLQFGPREDFAAYPRPEENDLSLLESAGVDLALLLDRHEMYPPEFCTSVTQSRFTTVLEGALRAGHFDGVLTVVCKLFGLVRPTRAYFGQKDYQQTVVVRRMIQDLELPLDLVVCPIRRDADGLALSSRNVYLSPDERARGLALVDVLRRVEALFAGGETSAAVLEDVMFTGLRQSVGHAPDYACLVDPDDLSPRDVARRGDMAVVAARIGHTRLLDNHRLGDALPPAAP